jgi:D-glycero-D-manno-heptose 1,7-bisphosphate phosphatase
MKTSPNEFSPAVFLDRDGTLMRDVDYCGDPADVAIYPGVPEALLRLKRNGYKLIVITNQSGIDRGYFSVEQYQKVEREVARQIGDGVLDATYYCADLVSARRKPEPQMVFEAQRDHQLDLVRSFLIGDKASDIECGRRAGVHTILVETGYGADQGDARANWVARDLVAAAEIILKAANG